MVVRMISNKSLNEFELVAMEFAEAFEIKTKDDLELCSATLHEHLESAMQNFAEDMEIDDYEPQY
mgnify:CR=1 FL=1